MIGNKIREFRKEKKLSQYKFAEIMNFSQSKISKIESNKLDLKTQEVEKICKVLKIKPEELF